MAELGVAAAGAWAEGVLTRHFPRKVHLVIY